MGEETRQEHNTTHTIINALFTDTYIRLIAVRLESFVVVGYPERTKGIIQDML